MTLVPRYRLDVGRLYRELDFKREDRGLTWAQIAEQTGLAAPLFSRMAAGRSVSADTLITLLMWMTAQHYLPYIEEVE